VRPRFPLVALVVVALVSGEVTASPVAAQAPAPPVPPASPYRIGYVSTDRPGLWQWNGEGTSLALPGGTGSVDFDATAAAGALVWASGRVAASGAAERDGELWYLKDGETTPRRLTTDEATDRNPALSPDARTVAFTSDRSGNPDIWVIGVDGSGLRRVTDSPAEDTWPTWSPDGTTLAFGSTREDPAGEIYTVPAAGGTPTRLTTDPASDREPAWSPSGDRIAFTTTRFHPAGDVVLMPVAGGAVTRAVPDPGDSAEPAWDPAGNRLAFTRRAADPLGDVYQVTLGGGAVEPVSAREELGETEPTWRRTESFPGGTVLFTQLHASDSRDIWSSDARGGDRRDLTDRPDADETDPAFSLDGARLAYTEEGTGELFTSRVMVADADGRAPKPLTGPEPGRKLERHPSWSPDGTMIALTKSLGSGDGTRDIVRIFRVADGRALGDIPIPDHLRGDDVEPAWSPDGTRVALRREATRKAPPPPSNVDPPVAAPTVARGQTTTIDTTVHTQKVPEVPDIVLLIDQTGSMSRPIEDVKKNLPEVIKKVRDQQPSANFAVAVFGDGNDPPDRLFHVQQQMTPADTPGRLATLVQALNDIRADGGGDTAEDWINALHQVATGAITFRPESSKIVVLIGDAESHDPSVGTYLDNPPGSPLLPELAGAEIRVVAVPVTPTPGEALAAAAPPGLDLLGQATKIAGATHGVVTTTTDPAEVANQIVAGIGDLPVTITPAVRSCDPGLSLTFAPDGPVQVPGGQDVGYTETARVADTAPAGAILRCTVEFRLNGEGGARPGYVQEIVVRVNERGLPVITLTGSTVDATGPAGAVIAYPVSAADATGRPLTPACTPPPGATFPVGVTTVTCSATDLAGNTAVAVADMTVAQPPGPSSRTLWLVSLSRPSPDQVVVTGQIDLSARIGPPCANGEEDSPDWSPDGGSLAFENVEADMICVAGSGGANGRILFRAGEAVSVADPAWSPDGGLVAFTAYFGEDYPRIRAVPAAGGEPVTLIDTPGELTHPVFQRVADLALTARALPPSIPFGGRTTLEYVVANHGLAVSPATELVVVLPAGLAPEQVTTSKGTCAGLRCALGPLTPGNEVTVRVVVTGSVAGTQVVTAELSAPAEANPADNRSTLTVTVAEADRPPVRPGSLALALAVAPNPAFVGGDDVVVTYSVRNGSDAPMPDVRIVTTVPAASLPANTGCAGSCALGELAPGQAVDVRVVLAAKSTVDGVVSGRITTSGPDSDAGDNTASARIVVRRPVLAVDPGIGPPGLVTRATGTDFPPGARIRLTWTVGISATPGEVTVGADGRFDTQVLIFHRDLLGVRNLAGTPVSGPKFGTVQSNPFLVVPRTEQPPFLGRG
jgi:Tol biopolymer transport system component